MACGLLCALAGCTLLFVRGQGETLIQVEVVPEAKEVALQEGQHGESLRTGVGAAFETKAENESGTLNSAPPSEAEGEGATPLVEVAAMGHAGAVNKPASRALLGYKSASSVRAAASRLGIRLAGDERPRVVSLSPEQVAAEVGGLAVNDVILTINGQKVRGHAATTDILETAVGAIKLQGIPPGGIAPELAISSQRTQLLNDRALRGIYLLCGLYLLCGSCVAIPLLAKGLWAVRAFLRVLLAVRPRLCDSLRQVTMCFACILLIQSICRAAGGFLLFSPPHEHALRLVVILSVALDIEWWFHVEGARWRGMYLAGFLFPISWCLWVIFCGLFLLDVLVLTKEDPRILLGQNFENLERIFFEHLVNYTVNKIAAEHPAALINGATKIVAFKGTQPKHWPPPLVVPESLDDLIGDNDTPREFVCPLTFGLMRQPAVTPHGTTYDYEAVASWADAQGRSPANESNQSLSRSELAPNRVLRSMIEEWVAARSTVYMSIVINP